MSSETLMLDRQDFDRAFEADEFVVLFQPKVKLATGRATGCEAFVRWAHPAYGMLLPALFLDRLEKNGRMVDLTRYVLAQALATCRAWRDGGYDWTVSVNLSTDDLLAPGMADFVAEALRVHGLPGSALILEVREYVVSQTWALAEPQLRNLRRLGCGVALDGPGLVPIDLPSMTGMPFTEIKIGGSAIIRFAQVLGARPGAIAGVVPKRIADATRLGLERTAVGAEDEITLRALTSAGFSCVQGELLQRPVPAEELCDYGNSWLARRDALPDPEPVLPIVFPVRAAPAETEADAAAPADTPATDESVASHGTAPAAATAAQDETATLRTRLRRPPLMPDPAPAARRDDAGDNAGVSVTATGFAQAAAERPALAAAAAEPEPVLELDPLAEPAAVAGDEPLDLDYDEDEYVDAPPLDPEPEDPIETEDDSDLAAIAQAAPLTAAMIERPSLRTQPDTPETQRLPLKTSASVAERFAPAAHPRRGKGARLLEELGLGALLGRR